MVKNNNCSTPAWKRDLGPLQWVFLGFFVDIEVCNIQTYTGWALHTHEVSPAVKEACLERRVTEKWVASGIAWERDTEALAWGPNAPHKCLYQALGNLTAQSLLLALLCILGVFFTWLECVLELLFLCMGDTEGDVSVVWG